MNMADAKRVLETALICTQQPMPLRDMKALFGDALGLDSLKLLLENAASAGDAFALAMDAVTEAVAPELPMDMPLNDAGEAPAPPPMGTLI